MNVGEVVRLERLRRRWSREEFGGLVGMDKSKVARIEEHRQELRASELDRVCEVFGLTATELLALAKEPVYAQEG